jgi:hypothetical protein
MALLLLGTCKQSQAGGRASILITKVGLVSLSPCRAPADTGHLWREKKHALLLSIWIEIPTPPIAAYLAFFDTAPADKWGSGKGESLDSNQPMLVGKQGKPQFFFLIYD